MKPRGRRSTGHILRLGSGALVPPRRVGQSFVELRARKVHGTPEAQKRHVGVNVPARYSTCSSPLTLSSSHCLLVSRPISTVAFSHAAILRPVALNPFGHGRALAGDSGAHHLTEPLGTNWRGSRWPAADLSPPRSKLRRQENGHGVFGSGWMASCHDSQG